MENVCTLQFVVTSLYVVELFGFILIRPVLLKKDHQSSDHGADCDHNHHTAFTKKLVCSKTFWLYYFFLRVIFLSCEADKKL